MRMFWSHFLFIKVSIPWPESLLIGMYTYLQTKNRLIEKRKCSSVMQSQ